MENAGDVHGLALPKAELSGVSDLEWVSSST